MIKNIKSLLLVFSALALVVAPVSAAAQTTDPIDCRYDFNIEQDIRGYSRCSAEVVPCPPEDGSGTGTSTTVPSGGSTAEQLFKFLIAKGLTAKQAAGVIGNVMQESGGGTFNLKPGITNPNGGAYGIIQWFGGRKTALLAYAASVGKPSDDLGMQLDFLWQELSGGYKSSVLDPIKATSDLREPTKIWLERFEIPCLPGSPECASELTTRLGFATQALSAFGGLSPEELASATTSGSCSSTGPGGTGVVDVSGYAFPVVLPKNLISNGYTWPCRTSSPYCHHDGSPAFDISKKPDNNTTGSSVVAISDGKIVGIGMNYMGTGCQSINFIGKDGYKYWYGHIRTDGSTPAVNSDVKAGAYLARVGESLCTGNGSYPHLHIDQVPPSGSLGSTNDRNPAFVGVMNNLYNNLPGGN